MPAYVKYGAVILLSTAVFTWWLSWMGAGDYVAWYRLLPLNASVFVLMLVPLHAFRRIKAAYERDGGGMAGSMAAFMLQSMIPITLVYIAVVWYGWYRLSGLPIHDL